MEDIVVALGAWLEVELDVDVLGEFLGGLDEAIALHGGIVNQFALDHLEAAVIRFGLSVERFLLGSDLFPAVEVLAVEQKREAGLDLEIVGRPARHRRQHQQADEKNQVKQSSHGSTS